MEKPKKVCLLTDHHISMNPRLWKEAFFYENLGFEVVILSMWQSDTMLSRDYEILKGHSISYKAYLNLIPGQVSFYRRFFYRARKRISGEIQRFLNISLPWALSYAPGRMVRIAKKEEPDFYGAHLECGFFAGRELIKAGKKVCFDFEDWYSRDYLVPERPVKLLEILEKFALKHALFCTAASRSMAEGLLEYYKINREIIIIYNGFPIASSQAIDKFGTTSNGNHIPVLWFSRTIGPHRGLEYFLEALKITDIKIELHLLGEMSDGYHKFLESAFPHDNGHRLLIHPFMPHDELVPFISRFKIGLAIEENINDNRKLTITNKMLQYLQAGLMVVASDTRGQKEVANYFPASVRIVDLHNPRQLLEAIIDLNATHPVNQQEIFNKNFSWEVQEDKIKDLIERHL